MIISQSYYIEIINNNSPSRSIKNRIYYISSNRREEMIFENRPVKENMSKLLLLNKPIQGIDVGTKEDVYNLLCNLVNKETTEKKLRILILFNNYTF